MKNNNITVNGTTNYDLFAFINECEEIKRAYWYNFGSQFWKNELFPALKPVEFPNSITLPDWSWELEYNDASNIDYDEDDEDRYWCWKQYVEAYCIPQGNSILFIRKEEKEEGWEFEEQKLFERETSYIIPIEKFLEILKNSVKNGILSCGMYCSHNKEILKKKFPETVAFLESLQ